MEMKIYIDEKLSILIDQILNELFIFYFVH